MEEDQEKELKPKKKRNWLLRIFLGIIILVILWFVLTIIAVMVPTFSK